MLIVLGGAPGTGKSTLAREVARGTAAVILRVDSIEAAIWRAGVDRSQPTGLAAYAVAQALAEGHLALGASVIVDAVNPVEEARRAWRDLASSAAVPLRFIEVVCSARSEHRRRVAARTPDIPGFEYPSWERIVARRYDPWTDVRLVVDTVAGVQACARAVLDHLS